MKVLVLGATGGTGREVVAQALAAAHEATVLVRDPARLPPASANRVRVVTGSVTDNPNALAVAVRGQDAVISALGAGTSLKSRGLMTYSTPLVVQAMTDAGVKRLIVTSACGVGVTWRDVPFLPRIFMQLLLRDLYADKAASEEMLRRSTLDWTLVYPVALTNGPRTGRYQSGERLALTGFPKISRADVAEFLLTQLADPRFVTKGVLVR